MNLLGRSLLVLLTTLLGSACAEARTLDVGADRAFRTPSEAIAAARSGDTVMIAPGEYFDCAVVRQDDIVLQGSGPGAVMTDKTCGGKGILVIDGDNVTVRNLTLQRARVADHNGAGIRAEGGNLTVENSRFINNENGILAGDNPKATIRILGSEFIGNGKCDPSCAHAVYIGRLALLHVEHCRFADTHAGHHIKSRAFRTEIVDNDMTDGPNGTSSYLIDIPNGGALVVQGNRMEKGPNTGNPGNTIMIGEEGIDRPTPEIVIKDNVFTNDQNRPTNFVTNITATSAELSANTLKGQVRPLDGDGSLR